VSDDDVGRTLALYCQLCDDGRFDEWGELFVEDARFTVLGQTHEGREDIKAWISKAQAPELRGKHFLGQSVVDIDATGDRASGVTDYTFVNRTPEGAYAITSAGRYYDTFVRSDDGRWRFVTREIRFLGS
jgi:3-phenylpropionate/cinnamic acid dioxygenase small subunit